MATLKKQLYDIFQAILRQRDQARVEITRAQETIALLEAEIAALKFRADDAFARVAVQQGSLRHQGDIPAESPPGTHWISDLWLSTTKDRTLLGEAEGAWERNLSNAQEALNVVAKLVRENTSVRERIKCALFVCAVLLANGRKEEACANANEALRLCGTDFRYKHLAGIAHYLRGRVFLEIQSLRLAYWDFSLAIFTGGYHERAKFFQNLTESQIMQQELHQDLSGPDADGPGEYEPPQGDTALKLRPEIEVPVDGFTFENPNSMPQPDSPPKSPNSRSPPKSDSPQRKS